MYNQIYLTGFKKFGNVQVNPTQLIVDQLLKNPIEHVHPTKLDVTIDQVDKYIQERKKEQSEAKNKILNIHFGVAASRKLYSLENCAYNNKDFGIPDNSGKICEMEKICHNKELDQAIKTGVDLPLVSIKLISLSFNNIQISQDPGRYLCNYVYFSSLNQLKGNKDNIDCLFVHFPGLDTTAHEENMKFVRQLLDILLSGN